MTTQAQQKRVLLNSDDYKRFRQYVPLHKVNVDTGSSKVWRYYEWGPKDATPLILLPGASGTAECFFMQLLSLCPKGYRLIAAQYPSYNSYDRFIRGFDRFIDHVGGEGTSVTRGVHLFGTVLGGYLSLCYAQSRPNRVKSIILCNSFADTQYYADNSPLTAFFSFTPKFLLQSLLMENFPDGFVEARIADSVDFMVYFLEHGLTQSDLASRLILNCNAGPVKGRNSDIALSSDRITIIDTTDEVALPEELRDNLYYVALPKAHKAFLKTGGNFPYLSRPEEVNMHIEVHLRRVAELDAESPISAGATNKDFVQTHVVPQEPKPESNESSSSDDDDV